MMRFTLRIIETLFLAALIAFVVNYRDNVRALDAQASDGSAAPVQLVLASE